MKKLAALLLIVAAGLTLAGCSANEAASGTSTNNQLSVLYAGSMTKVMEQKVAPDVKSRYGLIFQGEGKGSDALAQMMRSGLRRPDIFISASPTVNNRLLMGAQNHNIVKWYLTMAEDQLVIAYSPRSKFKAQLDAAAKHRTPWYQVLEQKGFLLGRTDPLLDPKGVNTLFLFDLASTFYHQPNLGQKILGATENPNQVFPEESLLAQLTSGQLDAIIAYKHEAVEWGTPYITLPSAVSLGDPAFAKQYAKAEYKGKGGKIQKGAPIVFTITIPDTASNEKGAQEFVQYMVSGAGHDILIKDGFTPMKVELAGARSAVPASLQALIKGTMK